MEHGIMARPLDLFPLLRLQPARSAPFLGRRRQQDALYRTIPGAAFQREAAAAAVKTADGGAQILTYPAACLTPDTR
jgi:hypothetical protein